MGETVILSPNTPVIEPLCKNAEWLCMWTSDRAVAQVSEPASQCHLRSPAVGLDTRFLAQQMRLQGGCEGGQRAPLTAAKGTAAGFQSHQDFSYNLQGWLQEGLFWESESHFYKQEVVVKPGQEALKAQWGMFKCRALLAWNEIEIPHVCLRLLTTTKK